MKKTYIYIDGFNLYYGCLQGTPFRWLNPLLVCKYLLPKDNIARIKYFTALVSARKNDPDQPVRQQAYLRALLTLSELEIHYGHFLTHVRSMPLAIPQKNEPPTAKVISTQEKGSDVNLASHLLIDAFRNHFDTAVVISNDSDLFTPIQIVSKEFKKSVGILNPQERPSRQLLQAATFFKRIRPSVLQISQFPPVLQDRKGSFHKPEAW